jgi:cobyrinic acid a,c-diamide synthase
MITKISVVDKLKKYLNQIITKEELIYWCESLMQEESFESNEVQEVVARLGLMDAKNFEVSYEELIEILHQLGYHLRVEIV